MSLDKYKYFQEEKNNEEDKNRFYASRRFDGDIVSSRGSIRG